MQQEPFFVNTYSFSVQHETYLVNMSLLLGVTYFFCCHNITLLPNVNFYVKYFFLFDTVFCATQDFFVLPNVSIKNIVNKEKHV